MYQKFPVEMSNLPNAMDNQFHVDVDIPVENRWRNLIVDMGCVVVPLEYSMHDHVQYECWSLILMMLIIDAKLVGF